MMHVIADGKIDVRYNWRQLPLQSKKEKGTLKHLFGLTLVHYRELVCLDDVIVGSGFAVAHYPSSKHTNSR